MIDIKLKIEQGEINMEIDVEDILHTELIEVVERHIRDNIEEVMQYITVEE